MTRRIVLLALVQAVLASLALIAGSPSRAVAVDNEEYPSVDDLLPSGPGDYDYLFSAAHDAWWIYTGESPGLPQNGSYEDSADLWLGTGDDEEYPESLTVTVRSSDPTHRFEVYADTDRSWDKRVEDMLGFGAVGSDDPVTVRFVDDQVRGLKIRPEQHGRFTVLVQHQFASSHSDWYVEHKLAFSFDRFGSADFTSTDGAWGDGYVHAENYEATGHVMGLEWGGSLVEQNDTAVVTVEGPTGWITYTGRGTTTKSPITVDADMPYLPGGGLMFRPTQPGDYTFSIQLGDYSADLVMRADSATFAYDQFPVQPPSHNCVPYNLSAAGPDGEDPQLLVNGEATNGLVVKEGETVTFSWPDGYIDGEQATVSLNQVWGDSEWEPVGAVTDIVVPTGADTADVNVTFLGEGCNLVQMGHPWLGADRYAYVTVEAADEPGPTPTPPPTPPMPEPDETAGTVYVPVEPCRLFDTRDTTGRNTPLSPQETHVEPVVGDNGACSIPETATAVAMNVTVVNPTTASYLTVFPADASRPLASHLNWVGGQPATPNKVDVKLSADGVVALYNNAGSVDVLADVAGYYTGTAIDALEARIAALEARLN